MALKPYQVISSRLKKVRGRMTIAREVQGEFATLEQAMESVESLDRKKFRDARIRTIAWEVLPAGRVYLEKGHAESSVGDGERCRAIEIDHARLDLFIASADESGRVDVDKANKLSRGEDPASEPETSEDESQ